MMSIGFWRTSKGFISHKYGLTEEQVKYLQNLKVGDRLSLFANDVREGENSAELTLKRSTLPNVERPITVKPEVAPNAVQA